jgi:cytochrome c oxidase cbb3-type subunit 2
MFIRHEFFEKNAIFLLIGTLVTVAIGGIVEIVPLFTIETTVEHVEGMRPYSPLELRGRDIYVREGCYLCHSQQIRTLRDEVERYGHYSIAAESMYDHPFQWGSKRIGPDLARVGGKYSNDWHYAHLRNAQEMVPGSLMPHYAFLEQTPLDTGDIQQRMRALRLVGVPYTIRTPTPRSCSRIIQKPTSCPVTDTRLPRPTPSSPTCRCWAHSSTSPTPTRKGCNSDHLPVA